MHVPEVMVENNLERITSYQAFLYSRLLAVLTTTYVHFHFYQLHAKNMHPIKLPELMFERAPGCIDSKGCLGERAQKGAWVDTLEIGPGWTRSKRCLGGHA